jgi:hypothetical protein
MDWSFLDAFLQRKARVGTTPTRSSFQIKALPASEHRASQVVEVATGRAPKHQHQAIHLLQRRHSPPLGKDGRTLAFHCM